MLIDIIRSVKNRIVQKFNIPSIIDKGEKWLFEKHGFPVKKLEIISKAVLKKYLPKNAIVIDCGAHDGKDSIELAKIFKKGLIHSFEPVPKLFDRLKKRTGSYQNIRCYNIALSDKVGNARFYISSGESDASSSLLVPQEHLDYHPETVFNENIDVKSVTLESWARTERIKRVDLLWLDMQGYEFQMLEASDKILSTVKVIHTEVSTAELYKEIGLYKDYKLFLEKKGFTVKIEAIPKGWAMGNVLFVRK